MTTHGRQVAPSIHETLPDVEPYLIRKLPLNGRSAVQFSAENLPGDKHYLLRNPNHQSYQTVNLEPEPKECASRISEHLIIIPICCGEGLTSLAVLKTT